MEPGFREWLIIMSNRTHRRQKDDQGPGIFGTKKLCRNIKRRKIDQIIEGFNVH
jgi:hypothetical protein